MKVTLAFILFLGLTPLLVQGQSDQVTDIVSAIAKSGSLGFDKDQQHARFIKLEKSADTDQLVLLTDHDSPAVRGYAFWALARRSYPDLRSIFIAHLDDKAKVFQKNGCMVGDESVISFMKQVVTPYMYDPDCMKLDDSTRALVE